MTYAFLRSPVGNRIMLMLFGFCVLFMPLEDKGLKSLHFAFVFTVFSLTRKASLSFNLRNESHLMGWAFWLRGVGIKGGSRGSVAVLPILYAVGYLNEKSFYTQVIIGTISP